MEPNQPINQSIQLSSSPSQPKTAPFPVTAPQSNSSKFPIILLTIISLLSLSGLVYFYLQAQSLKQQLVMRSTPTPTTTTSPLPSVDPVSDWQIYANKSLGYSIKYPSSAIFDYSGNTPRIRVFGPSYKEIDTYNTDGIVIILPENYTKIPPDLPAYVNQQSQETVNNIKIINPDLYKNLDSTKERTIGHVNGYSFTLLTTLDRQTYIYLPSSQGLAQITTLVADPSNLGFSDLTNEILSTFQFIDSQ